jgi:hypothetical protein
VGKRYRRLAIPSQPFPFCTKIEHAMPLKKFFCMSKVSTSIFDFLSKTRRMTDFVQSFAFVIWEVLES